MYKKIRNLITTAAFAALAALPACDDPSIAEPGETTELATPAELGLGAGWTELQPGLWTRGGEDGGQEFAGIGEPGRAHAVASLESVEEQLRQRLFDEERADTRMMLEELDALITELRATEIPISADDVELRCSPAVSAVADAYPISCGVAAKATASYSGCGPVARVRTYAQAGCGAEIKTHQCGYKTGNPVSCSSQMTFTGAAPCYSYALSEVSAPNTWIYLWDENSERGSCYQPPPPCGGECPAGKSCHCGDICRPNNTLCP
ncbi:hypothetical protein OV203_08500 [Nannocystis sp. ILAH1]|uniref:hypothetical protein n=1 Tax=Nannocystis sp. ILAH1 TaxID=2996789 RepID=UPI00226F8868|nr:hypothetical protein [Nannocystis sp. ILAH1]MCY0987161.1 hypothetical protein [Nannocystis sp. ILAH1]